MQKITAFCHRKLWVNNEKGWQHLNLRFIMKVSAAVIVIMTMSVQLLFAGKGFSQTMEQKQISLELNGVTLRNALNKIEKISGFRLAYILEQVSGYKSISLLNEKRSVAATLRLILSDTKLDFRQDDNTILIFPKPKEAIKEINAEAITAQAIVISGKVTNNNGDPLSGVSVYVKGNSSIGTVTDNNGNYRLEVPNNATTLIFSFIGTETQEIAIAGQTEINVSLKSIVQQQEEVVVVGYGTQKKKDLTGAISSVNSEHMNLGGTTANIAQALQGRAAGVRVQQNDFSPGGAISIVVRGGNTINTTNEPLYVVDGFISDNGKFINPNDIADIQILKDASATAIYGSRGGNGVVLITTKKGESGKMQIVGDASNGQQYLTYNPPLLTGQQYADIQNATALEDGKPPVFPSSFPIANTNWWDAATQQASILNRSVNLSGNDKNSKLFLSGNYFKQNGVLRNTSMERYSARMGGEKKFSERVKIGANFYGASTNYKLQRYNSDITAPVYSLLVSAPALPIYNSDGSYYRYQGRDNAIAAILEPTNVSTNRLINGNMYGDYEIIKNLTYHLSGGAEYSQTTAGQYTPKTLSAGLANRGIAQEQMSTSFRWLVEQYLTYKYVLGFHSLTALVGTSSQKDVIESLAAGSRNYSTDVFLFYNLFAGATPTVQGAQLPASNKIETKLASYYGRLNYSYRDRFLATFTLRDDISSRFGPNNRHGIFPSGALAWRLNDESFMEGQNIFSSLKLRVSYGLTGNDRIGDYAYLTRFSPYSTVLSTSGNLSAGVEPASLSNNNLKWEETAQTDIGIDMGFLNGRISATIDLYKKKTTDILLSVPVGQWWGFNAQTANAGAMENKGIELSVSSDNIRGHDLLWSTTFNVAYNKQKCLALANSIKFISTNTANPSGVVSGREFTRLEPGKEMGVLYGYKYAGVIKTGETYAPQPLSKPGDPKYVDVNGDGKITPDDATYLGNTNPRIIAAIGNDFQYKGFSLSIFFQGAFDYYLYNMNRLVLESTTSTDALNRWVASKNENTDIPREGYFLSTYGSYVNSRFVENASYIRLKLVSLGYDVPVHLAKKVKFIDGLRIYVSGQNLATFTKYTGTDPEVNGHSGNNLGGGIDFNGFPAFRTFTFGAKLTIH
ncbi:MAG: TonB-dependent receptor [Bacteroidetes bacterium]|nr:TonB-dependent receptor [Bacteroidota bacterium]